MNENLCEGAIIKGFHFHGGFVGFDLGEDFTDFHWISDFLVPFDKSAFGHGIRQFGHFDVYGHGDLGMGVGWENARCTEFSG